jgi:hypothetical protein
MKRAPSKKDPTKTRWCFWTLNSYHSRLLTCFKCDVRKKDANGRSLISPHVLTALLTAKRLRRGRASSKGVRPSKGSHHRRRNDCEDDALPFPPAPSCRDDPTPRVLPSEVLTMTPAEVDRLLRARGTSPLRRTRTRTATRISRTRSPRGPRTRSRCSSCADRRPVLRSDRSRGRAPCGIGLVHVRLVVGDALGRHARRARRDVSAGIAQCGTSESADRQAQVDRSLASGRSLPARRPAEAQAVARAEQGQVAVVAFIVAPIIHKVNA